MVLTFLLDETFWKTNNFIEENFNWTKKREICSHLNRSNYFYTNYCNRSNLLPCRIIDWEETFIRPSSECKCELIFARNYLCRFTYFTHRNLSAQDCSHLIRQIVHQHSFTSFISFTFICLLNYNFFFIFISLFLFMIIVQCRWNKTKRRFQ